MKNKTRYGLATFFISILFLIAGCSTENAITITTDTTLIANDKIKTYRWYDKSQSDVNSPINEIVRDYIKNAIDRELAAKGLSQQNDAEFDVYVNFNVLAETRADVKAYKVYSGTVHGYNWNRYGGFQADLQTEDKTDYLYYREGSLIIDFIDPASDKLVWRGVARKRITKETSQAEREKVIDEAVSAVLTNFLSRSK